MIVHCRTGSLEIYICQNLSSVIVHCRTGSLENPFFIAKEGLKLFTAAQAA